MDLLDLPDNPIPAGAVVTTLTAEDGVRLRAARWPARQGMPRGTVCVFPGRAEQIEKYFHVVEKLLARGYAVAVLDWRGQGGSERLIGNPLKGHVRSFRHYGRDIEVFRKELVLPDCPPPFFGLGHSMGAHILLVQSPKLTPWLSRLVLSAPMLGFPPDSPPHGVVRLLANVLTAIGLGRMDAPGQPKRIARMMIAENNPLTTDPTRFAVMRAIAEARPDLTITSPTVKWVKEAARSIDILNADAFPATVPMPVLLVNAGADRIVSARATETMARRLRNPAYVLVPGAQHEILMEREVYAAQFWAAFDAFIPGSQI